VSEEERGRERRVSGQKEWAEGKKEINRREGERKRVTRSRSETERESSAMPWTLRPFQLVPAHRATDLRELPQVALGQQEQQVKRRRTCSRMHQINRSSSNSPGRTVPKSHFFPMWAVPLPLQL
jgi:hypothetical protein